MQFVSSLLITQLQAVTVVPVNFVGLSPHQLLDTVLKLSFECNRLVGELSRVVIKHPSITNLEPLPVLPADFRGPRGSTPLLKIGGPPLPLASVWEKKAVGAPAEPPISGDRGESPRRDGTSDSAPPASKKPRPLRGEPPAEFSVQDPPVSSPLMLTRSDNSLEARAFLTVPQLLPIPEKDRYR